MLQFFNRLRGQAQQPVAGPNIDLLPDAIDAEFDAIEQAEEAELERELAALVQEGDVQQEEDLDAQLELLELEAELEAQPNQMVLAPAFQLQRNQLDAQMAELQCGIEAQIAKTNEISSRLARPLVYG